VLVHELQECACGCVVLTWEGTCGCVCAVAAPRMKLYRYPLTEFIMRIKIMQKFDLRCSQCDGMSGGVLSSMLPVGSWIAVVAYVCVWVCCWNPRHMVQYILCCCTKDEDIPFLTSLKVKSIAEI
jgi:hypothetical protein